MCRHTLLLVDIPFPQISHFMAPFDDLIGAQLCLRTGFGFGQSSPDLRFTLWFLVVTHSSPLLAFLSGDFLTLCMLR